MQLLLIYYTNGHHHRSSSNSKSLKHFHLELAVLLSCIAEMHLKGEGYHDHDDKHDDDNNSKLDSSV